MSKENPCCQFNLSTLTLHLNHLRTLSLQAIDFVTDYRWHLYFPFMVFPKYKILFLAVPRSGTSSLEYTLTPLLGKGLNFELDRYKHTFRHYMRSCTQREAATKFSNYFKFSVVRNPWTRLFSCYLIKVRSKPNRHFQHLGLDKCRTFEDFVLRIYDIPDEQADTHFMSQDYLLTYKDTFLPDKVYCFETYNQDWENLRFYLKQLTGIQLLNLPHYYQTKSDDYRRVYSTRLVDLVGERYHADCKRFGYTYPE